MGGTAGRLQRAGVKMCPSSTCCGCVLVHAALPWAKWEKGRESIAELQMGTIFVLFILWEDELRACEVGEY